MCPQPLLGHHARWGRELLAKPDPPANLFLAPGTGHAFAFTGRSTQIPPLSEVLQQAVDSLGFGARDARPIKMTSTNASFYFVDHAEKAMSEWHATYSKGTDGRNLQAAAAAAAIAQCFLGDNA
eukprot:jgi/Tetstr1/430095/TSEL_001956.t1